MIKKIARKIFIPPPPYHLKKNFTPFCNSKNNEIIKIFKEKYLLKKSEDKSQSFTKEDIESEIKEHIYDRIQKFRETIIPWLDSVIPLKGARILEIGCGTGSSTFALAEQGSIVTGVDIEEDHLEIARKRCELYGLNARFMVCNATKVDEMFKSEQFDLIIFFAALEHMTIQERIVAIRNTWKMLPEGKYWCITGSPNRLWFFDDHTSNLPFFHWLPDELAFLYSKYSPKKSLSGIYNEINDAQMLHFLRRGRGISFHEFECAIGNVSALNVVSSLSSLMRKNIFRKIKWLLNYQSRFEKFLVRVGPPINRGFYQPYLDLIIQK
jgi:S-adenosylmethionine-dependent methyltransferase